MAATTHRHVVRRLSHSSRVAAPQRQSLTRPASTSSRRAQTASASATAFSPPPPPPTPSAPIKIPRAHSNRPDDDATSTRDLFLSVLETTPTKRDAKPYLSRSDPTPTHHIALVKISALHGQSDQVVDGLARTLSYLNRLGLACLVVVDPQAPQDDSADAAAAAVSAVVCRGRKRAFAQADRLVRALESFSATKASRLDDLFALDSSASPAVHLQFPHLLVRTLRRGVIPVLAPVAHESESQRMLDVPPDDLVVALTRSFVGLGPSPLQTDEKTRVSASSPASTFQLDRIIILDPAGAIPSVGRSDATHVFINLEQEYNNIRAELAGAFPAAPRATIRQHLRNLTLLQRTLSLLPPTASALLAAPADAASPEQAQLSALSVGTRRSKNPLISSLLTDKPLISSSLPTARLAPSTAQDIEGQQNIEAVAATAVASRTTDDAITSTAPRRPAVTFAKRGMPLKMLPDPRTTMWMPPAAGAPGLSLEDTDVDLPRLFSLIEDSFGRRLDAQDYLARLRGRLAGVIIAGDYEGGAVVTWETPPSSPGAAAAAPVPYLDKFAVARRSQGAGGVADVVFGALVRACLPAGVVWRSRRTNPVNGWYFERAVGAWKLPAAPDWTMFWTVPALHADAARFADCEAVCRSVRPSWKDGGADN